MENTKQNKKIIYIGIFSLILFIVVLTISYAFLNQTVTGTKNQVISSGNLRLTLNEGNELTLTNALPMYDEVGMIQDPFTFTLTNDTTYNTNYIMKLKDVTEGTDKLSSNIVKYGLEKDGTRSIDLISNLEDMAIDEGTIKGNQVIEYTLRLWIDSSVEDENLIKGKSLSYRIAVDVKQDTKYKEDILNGTDPVLSSNLIPVTIESNGTVTYANVNEPWYNYEKQEWANAVVLEDNAKEYKAGDVIESTDVESYFVWIPRYKYKIFNDGTSNALNSTGPKTIEIEFENKDTPASIGTTVNTWLTHPAFTPFGTNGFWVGKFESGYRDANSTATAQVSTGDASMLVVKPNAYSWRNINIGNMFKTSYEYLRSDESHMMKNTEWGAVAYLSHSVYGKNSEIYINNNNMFLTGCGGGDTVSANGVSTCLNAYGSKIDGIYNQTTTGNISGVFDMSGGTWEYVMGYNTSASSVGGSSGITSLYTDFFTNNEWDKYYDKYTSNSSTAYSNRILGDATGEMGPFASNKSSWYDDLAYFVDSSNSWFDRGGGYSNTSNAGAFQFSYYTGGNYARSSFRVTLAPKAGE